MTDLRPRLIFLLDASGSMHEAGKATGALRMFTELVDITRDMANTPRVSLCKFSYHYSEEIWDQYADKLQVPLDYPAGGGTAMFTGMNGVFKHADRDGWGRTAPSLLITLTDGCSDRENETEVLTWVSKLRKQGNWTMVGIMAGTLGSHERQWLYGQYASAGYGPQNMAVANGKGLSPQLTQAGLVPATNTIGFNANEASFAKGTLRLAQGISRHMSRVAEGKQQWDGFFDRAEEVV